MKHAQDAATQRIELLGRRLDYLASSANGTRRQGDGQLQPFGGDSDGALDKAVVKLDPATQRGVVGDTTNLEANPDYAKATLVLCDLTPRPIMLDAFQANVRLRIRASKPMQKFAYALETRAAAFSSVCVWLHSPRRRRHPPRAVAAGRFRRPTSSAFGEDRARRSCDAIRNNIGHELPIAEHDKVFGFLESDV